MLLFKKKNVLSRKMGNIRDIVYVIMNLVKSDKIIFKRKFIV